jgi:hypothetical protein
LHLTSDNKLSLRKRSASHPLLTGSFGKTNRTHLLFLPAYSPELQPAEHLLVPGPLTNTVLINRHFADLEELEDAQARRCDAASPCSSAGISSARPRAFIGGRSVSGNAKDPGLRDMTPNPTPTRTYVSERRRPLPRACALFGHGSYALTAVSGRKESGSKTAVKRRCPGLLSFAGAVAWRRRAIVVCAQHIVHQPAPNWYRILIEQRLPSDTASAIVAPFSPRIERGVDQGRRGKVDAGAR